MQLIELINKAEDQARIIILGKHQSLLPTWILIDKSGNSIIRCTPWGSELEKRLAEAFIRLNIKMHRSVMYSFITEAWLAIQKPGEKYQGPASKDPDRKEVVVALATDGKEKIFRAWDIIRDWNDQPVKLEERTVIKEAESFVSWLGELFHD